MDTTRNDRLYTLAEEAVKRSNPQRKVAPAYTIPAKGRRKEWHQPEGIHYNWLFNIDSEPAQDKTFCVITTVPKDIDEDPSWDRSTIAEKVVLELAYQLEQLQKNGVQVRAVEPK